MVLPLFATIEIDPPWPERGGGQIRRGADRHYPLISYSEIPRTIIEASAFRPDPAGCACWLWTTASSLPEGLRVLDAIGFRYVSHGVWTKPGAPGIGQRFRCCHEILLLGTIGRVPLPAPSVRPPSVIEAKRRGHSVKPPEAARWTESTSPHLPRVSMFARTARVGWWTWGTMEAAPPPPETDHDHTDLPGPRTYLLPPLEAPP